MTGSHAAVSAGAISAPSRRTIASAAAVNSLSGGGGRMPAAAEEQVEQFDHLAAVEHRLGERVVPRRQRQPGGQRIAAFGPVIGQALYGERLGPDPALGPVQAVDLGLQRAREPRSQMLEGVEIAERIDARQPQRRGFGRRGAGAFAAFIRAFVVAAALTMHSLNNEIGKVDVTNAPKTFLLFKRRVDRLDQSGLQLPLSGLAGDLVLSGVAERHQHRRTHRDLVGLDVFDDGVVIRRGDRQPDLDEAVRSPTCSR